MSVIRSRATSAQTLLAVTLRGERDAGKGHARRLGRQFSTLAA
jgi:hypothetical protein